MHTWTVLVPWKAWNWLFSLSWCLIFLSILRWRGLSQKSASLKRSEFGQNILIACPWSVRKRIDRIFLILTKEVFGASRFDRGPVPLCHSETNQVSTREGSFLILLQLYPAQCGANEYGLWRAKRWRWVPLHSIQRGIYLWARAAMCFGGWVISFCNVARYLYFIYRSILALDQIINSISFLLLNIFMSLPLIGSAWVVISLERMPLDALSASVPPSFCWIWRSRWFFRADPWLTRGYFFSLLLGGATLKKSIYNPGGRLETHSMWRSKACFVLVSWAFPHQQR